MSVVWLLAYIVHMVCSAVNNNQNGDQLCLSSSRTTVVAVAAFLDAFQKVADLATGSRGKQMCLIAGGL